MTNNVIIDLGAHKGEDSAFYLKKGFKVIAVDASKKLCSLLEQRFQTEIQDGKYKVLNFAVTDIDADTVTFYENQNNSVWGTVFKEWDERNNKFGTTSEKHEITTTRLDTLIAKEVGCDELLEYVKIDIEGADILALESLSNVIKVPKFISLESEKVSWPKLLHEFEILKKLGYQKFKIVDQSKIDKQICPTSAIEGKFIDYQFEFGSSGLFGSELPGDWLKAEEAIKQYKIIFRRYYLFGDYGIFNNRFIMQNRILRKIMSVMKLNFPDVGWYDTHAAL